jgi:hypothetical protein
MTNTFISAIAIFTLIIVLMQWGLTNAYPN